MKIDYSVLLYEILNGKSTIRIKPGVCVYFKHPSIMDGIKQSVETQALQDKAKKIGLKSEEDLLEIAKTSGIWSSDKEDEINDLMFSTTSLEKNINKVRDSFMKSNMLNKIEANKKTLNQLNSQRSRLIKGSQEAFVLQMTVKALCKERLFSDEKLETPLKDHEIEHCIPAYNQKMSQLMRQENLIWAAYTPSFFELFLIYKESPDKIIGGIGIELTMFQKDLLIYGKQLMEKLRSGNLPKFVKGNPVDIYKWTPSDGDDQDNGEDFSIREKVKKAGGTDNMKPEDKIT